MNMKHNLKCENLTSSQIIPLSASPKSCIVYLFLYVNSVCLQVIELDIHY